MICIRLAGELARRLNEEGCTANMHYSSFTASYLNIALYIPEICDDSTVCGRYFSFLGCSRIVAFPCSSDSKKTRLKVVFPSSKRTKQSSPDFGVAAGEKITMSPGRY